MDTLDTDELSQSIRKLEFDEEGIQQGGAPSHILTKFESLVRKSYTDLTKDSKELVRIFQEDLFSFDQGRLSDPNVRVGTDMNQSLLLSSELVMWEALSDYPFLLATSVDQLKSMIVDLENQADVWSLFANDIPIGMDKKLLSRRISYVKRLIQQSGNQVNAYIGRHLYSNPSSIPYENNYVMVPTPGDGNCLFHAVSQSLALTSRRRLLNDDELSKAAEYWRLEVAKYIFNNRYTIHYSPTPFIFENRVHKEDVANHVTLFETLLSENKDFVNPTTLSESQIRDNFASLPTLEQYVLCLAQPSLRLWGGQFELIALAHLLNTNMLQLQSVKDSLIFYVYTGVIVETQYQHIPILLYHHMTANQEGVHFSTLYPKQWLPSSFSLNQVLEVYPIDSRGPLPATSVIGVEKLVHLDTGTAYEKHPFDWKTEINSIQIDSQPDMLPSFIRTDIVVPMEDESSPANVMSDDEQMAVPLEREKKPSFPQREIEGTVYLEIQGHFYLESALREYLNNVNVFVTTHLKNTLPIDFLDYGGPRACNLCTMEGHKRFQKLQEKKLVLTHLAFDPIEAKPDLFPLSVFTKETSKFEVQDLLNPDEEIREEYNLDSEEEPKEMPNKPIEETKPIEVKPSKKPAKRTVRSRSTSADSKRVTKKSKTNKPKSPPKSPSIGPKTPPPKSPSVGPYTPKSPSIGPKTPPPKSPSVGPYTPKSPSIGPKSPQIVPINKKSRTVEPHSPSENIIYTPTSYLRIKDHFLTPKDSDLMLEYVKGLPLQKDPKGKIFNKEITFHRSIGFFSDTSIGYKFSGQIMKTGTITDFPQLNDLLKRVNKEFETHYNGILVNIYTSGLDYIGAHSDDEKELDPTHQVVAISLGQPRTFRVRAKEKTNPETIKSQLTPNSRMKSPTYDVLTQHGQLLVMGGQFQKEFTHEIPVEKGKDGIRASLTFRYHKK